MIGPGMKWNPALARPLGRDSSAKKKINTKKPVGQSGSSRIQAGSPFPGRTGKENELGP